MDDTVSDDVADREQVLLEMIKSGMFAGISAGSREDIKPNQLVLYSVERAVVESGYIGGAAFQDALLSLPEGSKGRVVLMFEGWMSDPRELFEVPEVVDFCRGMFFGIDPKGPDPATVRDVLSRLFDERQLAWPGFDWNSGAEPGPPSEPHWLTGAGLLFMVGMCFPTLVWFRDTSSPSGWSRDITANLGILTSMNGGPNDGE